MGVCKKPASGEGFREEDIVFLPESLLGFEGSRKIHKAVLEESLDNNLICWLRPMGHKDLVFPLLETHIFYPEYRVKLSSRERSILEIDPEEDIQNLEVYSILSIPEDISSMEDLRKSTITANLKAPLVISPKNKRASQIVLQETKYRTDYPLREHLSLIFPSLKTLELEEKEDLNFVISSEEEKIEKKEPGL